MEELQNIDIQNLISQLPLEIQNSFLNFSEVLEVCEYLVSLLNNQSTINSVHGNTLVELMHCIAINSDIPLLEKAQYKFKYALFCQNLLKFDNAEKKFLEARDLFSVLEIPLAVNHTNVYLSINSIYLAKFAESQQYLLLAEEALNFTPKPEELDHIRVLCQFLKAVNYVHLGTASRKGYIAYTEKIYNFFNDYKILDNWNDALLASYFSLLQSSVEASMLIEKYWLAFTILKELPKVIEHPNTFSKTKSFAKSEYIILESQLNLCVGKFESERIEMLESMFDNFDLSYFEFYNQKLNLSNHICEYYFKTNNYQSAKIWFSKFENQKIETQKYFVPEETSYIEFYNRAVQFFGKHGDITLTQKYIEINTKLHKIAIEKADNYRYEEMKLWKNLQKEKEQTLQLELQIETVRQQLITQIDSSLTLQQLLNDFSKTIHTSLVDVPEKKQNQLLKQVKKFNEIQQVTQQLNKFENDFSTIYPLFCSNFLQKHATITKTELSVCMAVLLSLSNQQIADFFHKEVKTVEEYIRRIRRKLKLEQRANLKAYLLLWTK